jgi:hypothetical protein
MKIKTIDLIDVLTEAVTSLSNVLRHIRNTFPEVVNEDINVFQLESGEYLMLTYPMDTLRKLIDMLPEVLVTDEMRKANQELYLYKAEIKDSDNLYNLTIMNNSCHFLHTEIHRVYREARDAIDLYS